ncbi:MAG: CoA transferase [Acetobacteraceae bacterium]
MTGEQGDRGRARPLAGLRVIEIGHSIAAPYAGMILGELGADVIKVENPKGGDYARGWGPPFSPDGTASAYEAVNRGKRGITVDLADPGEAAALRRLIERECDVLIHNLKFGAMDRLGLSSASLLAANQRLIYCNFGAFGAVGPMREHPGYDPLMQAFGGLMSVLGENGRPPVRVGVSIIDLSTGMWSVIGILAALQRRTATGAGGVVDASLYESALAWMTVPIAAYACSGEVPRKTGSGTAQIVPYQAFATADGHLMVAAGTDNLFRRLAGVVGQPGLATDLRFRANADRVVNRDALIPVLEAAFLGASTAQWVERLEAGGVPSGPIQTVDQVVAHPQTKALGIIQTEPGGDLTLVGLPLSFDGVRPAFQRRPPGLGEHNAEILPQRERVDAP